MDASSSALDGKGREVSQLARSFLRHGAAESSAYVFHAYLYFAESDDATRPTRSAAAAAVLRLFRDVRSSRQRDGKAAFAALYIPITTKAAAVTVVRDRRADALVAEYDYERARTIRQRIEAATRTSLPRVALIGHPSPLDGAQPIDRSQLYAVSFVGLSPRAIEEKLLQFRRALESSYVRLDDDFPSWTARQARSFFERTGSVLEVYRGEPD